MEATTRIVFEVKKEDPDGGGHNTITPVCFSCAVKAAILGDRIAVSNVDDRWPCCKVCKQDIDSHIVL